MMATSNYIAIDTETNGKDVRDGRGTCYGVSVADEYTAMYLPFRHKVLAEDNLDFYRFRPLLQEILDTKNLIYFNAKFDIVSLATLGLDTRYKNFFDVMILSHMVNENQPYGRRNLDAVAKMYCNNEGKKKSADYLMALKLWGYENMSPEVTAEYAAVDARITYDSYIKLVPLLRQESLRKIWEHKRKFIELLIDMESAGIAIDPELCVRMIEQGEAEMATIRHSLNGMNLASPTDLKELLINRLEITTVDRKTPQGKPSFDKKAMEEYDIALSRMNNPLAKDIERYRGWQKSVSSNYKSYLEHRSPDHRLRTDYWLHGTKSGRMSAHEPNLQQIPRSGKKVWNGQMKKCFVPKPGFVLVEGDYSQLEFRLASHFAREQMLLGAFRDRERDVFTEMSKVLKMSRYDTKTLQYSLSYGAGVRRIMNAFGVSRRRAEEIIANHRLKYPNLHYASQVASQYAIMNKFVPMWSGRRCHFLHPADESHKAFNRMCQGGAADIVERTMLRLNDRGCNDDDCRMLLQVHDSVVFEIREEALWDYVPLIKRTMEDVQPEFSVPFHVSLHYWGEEDELTIAA